MPIPNGVYDKLNVIVDGEVQGMTLAPHHYALLAALRKQWKPEPLARLTIEGPDGRCIDPPKAIESGVATLGEPFDGDVLAITMFGDARPSIDVIVEMVRGGQPR